MATPWELKQSIKRLRKTLEDAKLDLEWNEQRQQKRRTTFAVGQDKKNNVPEDWKLDGLLYKKLDDEDTQEQSRLGKKIRYVGMLIGQAIKELGELMNEDVVSPRTGKREAPKREPSNSLWSDVDPDMALKLKQSGFDVRFLGGKRWQVRSK